ncbi:MAG TPA: cytochrome C oxidase subunit IV family protein [Candidatus Saccharimonadales bacterium]|jgi:heme/copper-type cytochrome/quinol oxidase subunit 4|nr:cytochrome C oxidase subunit IV family protein [Candidatus Saccharimonadales bacterium]
MDTKSVNHTPGMKSYGLLLLGLFAIVAIEVALTYQHFAPDVLLPWLLILAVLEASIAITYYMHLRYEQPKLVWSLFVSFVFVMIMMGHMFPDAMRLLHLRVIHW